MSVVKEIMVAIGGCSSVRYSEDMKNPDIELDIVNLCGEILAVLRNYYLTKEDFIKATNNEMCKPPN